MIDVGQVVVMGVAAGLCVAAASFLALRMQMSARMRAVLIGVSAGIAVGVSGGANSLGLSDWVNVALGFKSQMDLESEHLGERLMEDSRFRRLIEGKSSEEAQIITANLSKAGIQYLTEEQLTRWVYLQRRMAEHSSEFCAARWKGGMDPALFLQAVAALSDAERAEWLSMSTTATLAALQDGRPPAVPYDAMEKGLMAIFSDLPEEQRRAALADTSHRNVADERACELLKMVLSGAETLPQDQRGDFLRALTQL